LQVKLCDPCLSALCVPWCKKALYKYSSFPFFSLLNIALAKLSIVECRIVKPGARSWERQCPSPDKPHDNDDE